MNDLRSRSRALAAVPDEGSAPTSTPPRVRPETDEHTGRRMSRRQSITERARQVDGEPGRIAAQADRVASGTEETGIVEPAAADDHKFKSSRPRTGDGSPAVAEAAPVADDDSDPKGPASRPTRRRELAEETTEEEDRFPWHFQFDDDEPRELQASSPLLSRAFRATIG